LFMPKLIIDHREIEVPAGTNVLQAAELLGIMIPRFCYHPALGSLGACRVCAVMFLEGPVKGLEMSCMTAAKDGMVVSTDHPEARAFRQYVIEWLMLHHPLDCPVCDEGGHCLLQDETVSGGHGRRRYLGPKRTYRDQYLGAFVQHEMNRCIQCWRCRRFYQEFAGYRDLGAMQIGNRLYFGRQRDGALESPFAGNIIDLCPTGVFTDKPSRFKGRRWHYERGPSLCLHCSLGCNVTGSAYLRELLRLEARVNEAVNGHFICDRGRYGFGYTNLPERPRKCQVAGAEVPWEEGVATAARQLGQVAAVHGPAAAACLGGARSSLETQGRLLQFCRTLDWPDPYFFLDPQLEGRVRAAVARLDARLAVSLRQIEAADFVLVAGADPVNEAPMLTLALRQAWRGGAVVAVLDPRPVSLPFQFQHLPVRPGELEAALAALGKQALATEPPNLASTAREFYAALPGEFPGTWAVGALEDLAARLAQARRPVIVCGPDLAPATTIDLAADLALLLRAAGKEAGVFFLLPGPNAFGAALLTGEAARSGLLDAIESEQVKALVLVECDPFRDFPDRERLTRALERLEFLLVLDYLPSAAARQAHVFLPTVTVFERTGSAYVNQEGRLQWAPPVHFGGLPVNQISPERHPPRTFLNFVPGSDPKPAGAILEELARTLDSPLDAGNLWDWLAGNRNPAFTRAASVSDHPEGVRLLPEEQRQRDFLSRPAAPAAPPPGHLELLLVEAAFGTEELAGYSPYIRQVEEAPRLFMSAADAARLGVDGGPVALDLPRGPMIVNLRLADDLAPGVLVLPRHRQLAWQKLASWPALVPESAIRKASEVIP
jgi:NADH-quinone oxidoreductase subunit G